MLKRTEKYAAIAALGMLTALSACQREVLPVSQDAGKTPIELTVGLTGDNPAVTRSVVTTDQPYGELSRAKAFATGTSLYMVMKSEKDDADAVYSRTIGYAQEQHDAANTTVKFASAYGRFWEDSYSRNSQLSVYAACVPGYYLAGSVYDDVSPNGTEDGTTWTVGGSTTYLNDWNGSNGSTTIAWPLRSATVGHQSAAFVSSQDLCFSNNVSDLAHQADALKPDNRVTFNSSLKKFGSGRLVFYHALTKVTFLINKGEGFLTGDPFAFSNENENIVLKGFNTSGTFDIVDGEFKTSAPAIGTADITELAHSTNVTIKGVTYPHVLECLMLPGSNLNDETRDLIYFTIDNNLYHLTKKQLMDALASQTLSDDSTPALTEDHKMRPGVNYIFTMTVGKKKMDNFTAAVVPWEAVPADPTTPTNARIIVTLLDNGSKKTGDADFDLFRATNTNTGDFNDDWTSYDWTTGYAPTANPTINKAQLVENTADTGIYTAEESDLPHTAWYWPNNKTFYHFRTVMPKTDNTWKVVEHPTGDYITLARSASYTDVCWGAPFYALDNTHLSTPLLAAKLTYSLTTGFDNTGSEPETHQISKAIGPTDGTINLEMFHMMSDVTIQLTTPQSGDADYDARVTLSGATLNLTNTYSAGKVLMGNGLVTPTGDVSDVTETVDASYKLEHYGFIPQDLTSVVLTITTADNNQYIVDMKDVVASTVGNNLIANPYSLSGGKYIINRWYPNYKYTYTFRLVKTGIALISATLADWETVPAGNDNVQIR